MSAGTPDGAPPPAPDVQLDLAPAVEQLRQLVDLARIGNDIQRGIASLIHEQLAQAQAAAAPTAPTAALSPAPAPPPPDPGVPLPPAPAPPPPAPAPDLSPLDRTLQAMLQAMRGSGPKPPPERRGDPLAAPRPDVKVQRGLGGYVGRKIQQAAAGSRPARWGRAGQAAGLGLGRTLGLSAENRKRLGRAGAAVGGAAGAVGGIVEAFVKARDAVDRWTEGAMETAKRLSAVSGSMAAVAAQREVATVFREQERGERTAASAGRLQQAEAARKDEENKLLVVFDNAKNEVLTVFNNVFTPLLKLVNTGVDGVIELVANIPIVGGDIARRLRGDGDGDRRDLRDIGERARREADRREAAAAGLRAGAREAAAGARGAAPFGAAPFGAAPP